MITPHSGHEISISVLVHARIQCACGWRTAHATRSQAYRAALQHHHLVGGCNCPPEVASKPYHPASLEKETVVKFGTTTSVPHLPGRWSVWCKSSTPGGRFLVPADDASRATGIKHVEVREKNTRAEAKPKIELLNVEPSNPMPKAATA